MKAKPAAVAKKKTVAVKDLKTNKSPKGGAVSTSRSNKRGR